MLPFRFRAPNHGLKRGEEKQNDADYLKRGGPLQHAIEKDLLDTRAGFLQAVSSNDDSANISPHQQQHSAPGIAFSIFKRIFKAANLAYIHTRTVPPRCDMESYTQLIFAACLALLKDACCSNDTEPSLNEAAYALFCLYALYNTSPLPKHIETPLQLLPLGLQADNPKALFRRSFQGRIRIDRKHYGLIQRIRDEALSHQAECESRRMSAWCSRDLDGQAATASVWKCSCSVSTDVITIIDRLLPCFDLCEYTGPCGLEALAGHPEYPFGVGRNEKMRESVSGAEANTGQFAVFPEETPPLSLSDEFKSDLKRYREQVRSIQLPLSSSHQKERVKRAIEPLYDPSLVFQWNEVSRVVLGHSPTAEEEATKTVTKSLLFSRRARQEFANVQAESYHEERQVQAGETHAGTTPSAIQSEEAGPDMNYELVLPADLSQETQAGIRASLCTLLDRGCFQPAMPAHALAESTANEEEDLGQGQAALRALLSGASRHSQMRQPHGQHAPGDDFLAYEDDGEIGRAFAGSPSSPAGGSSGEDESDEETGLAVGQRALRDLLASVKIRSDKSSSRKRKNGSPRTRNAQEVKRKRAPAPSPMTERDQQSSDGDANGSGRTALAELLARATRGQEPSDS